MNALQYSKENLSGKPPDQTNRYSFGKVHVRIKGLLSMPNIGKLFCRLRIGPF